jgi:A/G-specific adenine glycosylase
MNSFTGPIYNWYSANQRNLPWRHVTDPYLIWISETILQQTRIAQGLPYYMRFAERFPDVKTLAEAPEDELLKLWEGLGYYSRARNLHFAAKSILKNYEGRFPDSYESILSLKGAGEYTAAAVASIAYGLPHAAVDGNVLRVLSRYFGIDLPIDSAKGRKTFRDLANELLLIRDPGMHNQAMMEFGALVCTPKNPDCINCPLQGSCNAFSTNRTAKLPVKSKRIRKTTRYFIFVLIESASHILLEKRISSDIWKNLWQLPAIETEQQAGDADILERPEISQVFSQPGSRLVKLSPVYIHELTHRKICARFVHVQCVDMTCFGGNFIQVNKEEMYKFAFPVLIKKYLAENSFL